MFNFRDETKYDPASVAKIPKKKEVEQYLSNVNVDAQSQHFARKMERLAVESKVPTVRINSTRVSIRFVKRTT